jgi:HEAT repeat protein
MALWRITGDPAPAVSVIADDLDDPREYTREQACERLAEIGPAAAGAVPALEANLTHESHRVRIAAAETLWKITGDAESVVPVLVDFLDEEYVPSFFAWNVRSSVSDRIEVIELLGQMGPAARAALPELRNLTEHESFPLRRAAASAIEKLTGA